jgi:lipoprotein-anchoring transpeptidase ErfK/SrfK
MRRHFIHAILFGVLLSSTAQAQAQAPDASASATPGAAGRDLSEAAIDSATFEEWQTRLKAHVEAEKVIAGEGDATVEALAAEQAANPATAPEGETPPVVDPGKTDKPDETPDPFLIRMQVLLDRAHASPGVIDGLPGGNTDKAIRAFETMHELERDGKADADFWTALVADAGKATQVYTLTQADLDERFVPDMPTDYGELAKLDWLGYRGVAEMLAERFHMDEDLLRLLNPDIDKAAVGQTVLVADPGAGPEGKVAKIIVDKSLGELIAYDADDKILLISPATIGSAGTPSPSGTMKVNGSAPAPVYEYNPDKNFQQGDNDKKLTLPGGPNGPVGIMWIDLSKPTYGIHGTPDPSKIDKTASHGCVRLTNWDAEALAKLVQPAKTVVEFTE